MKIQPITDCNLNVFLRKHDNFVVDFWAPWCQPCKAVTPRLKALAQEFRGRITFAKISIDRCPKVAEKFKVKSIPTLLLFRKREMIGRISGEYNESELKRRIESAFSE